MSETVHVRIEVQEVPGGYRPVLHLTGLLGRTLRRSDPTLVVDTVAEAIAVAHRVTEEAKKTTWEQYPDVEFVIEDPGVVEDGQHR